MFRTAMLMLVACCAVWFSGCGSSSSSTPTSTVSIQEFRFTPKVVTVAVDNRVQWVNTDQVLHQVVSGTLAPTPTPQLRTPNILIQQNNSFEPETFEMDLGDTVQFQNNRSGPITMDILDDSLTVVDTLNFQNAGQVIPYSDFGNTAGRYTVQQRDNSLFSFEIFVFGIPTPDNNFVSQVMGNGGSFQTQLIRTGTFPYYDLNQDDPDRSFMTGTVVVQ